MAGGGTPQGWYHTVSHKVLRKPPISPSARAAHSTNCGPTKDLEKTKNKNKKKNKIPKNRIECKFLFHRGLCLTDEGGDAIMVSYTGGDTYLFLYCSFIG